MSRKDPAWKYGTEIPNPTGKPHKYFECNFCKQQIKGGVARMKDHLAWTHRNVKACPKVPDEVKQEILDYVKRGTTAKEKRQEKFYDMVDAGAYFRGNSNPACEVADDTRSIRGPMDKFLVHVDDNTDGIPDKQAANPPQDMSLHVKEARKQVAMDIGRFFFENGISFNCIESPSFVSMCRSIGLYGKGLKVPSRHELSTWILKEEVKTTDVIVDDIKRSWIQTGVSILSDGWKDMRGRSLINFLVNNPHGTVFLRSIDASDAVKDANLLFQLLDGIVEEIGEELVVHVVTDNASNYKAAGKLLMEKMKSLYWTPCVAHCIDLMLEKLGELPQHKNALMKARKVSNFIYNHGLVLAMMRKHTNRELIRPATTRFATAFLTLESMMELRQPLQAMFTSTDWERTTWAKKNDGKEIKKIILSDQRFWRAVQYALNTTRPLVKVLRMVDGEQMPAMGFIYGAMDTTKEEIAKNVGGQLGDYKEIWDIIDAKWENQLHHDLHAAAYFLNPRFQYGENFSKHPEIKKGLLCCMEKLIPPADQLQADLQLDNFRSCDGLFGRYAALESFKTRTPGNWWTQYGDETLELQSFAVKVLSLTCSASACERNWSMFNQVHTKKRNRLTTQKLNSLVYIMYNRRLRGKHVKLTSRGGDIDPLEVDNLASDDEWYVGNEDEANEHLPIESGASTQMIKENASSSRTSKKRKKSTNSKGKNKRVMHLIDEDENEEEDEPEDDNDDFEINPTNLDGNDDEDEDVNAWDD
ncbi:uncharacterized protein LOC130998147 [Salvia miltiorrhiza]|uniref:uncharacterized protein LOC130998147 n=1 Tax=Salvia miltiorrhiza TaxID=226208 RepID=UPI0025AC5BC9|nr:uncharacterized protein LOC130998147 [Salvia miltiorrhiza]